MFGIVVGVLLAIALGYLFGLVGWGMGFLAGFGGTASHLLGDALTYSPFRPLYPFSQREVAYGFFAASSKTANNTMAVVGVAAFVVALIV